MSPTKSRICLLITTVVFGGTGLLGVMAALMSFMMFDAPGSEENPTTILLFLSVLTFPVVCGISIGLAWILYARKKFKAACTISFLPVLNLLCGAAALIWLQIFNDGRFA